MWYIGVCILALLLIGLCFREVDWTEQEDKEQGSSDSLFILIVLALLILAAVVYFGGCS